MIVEGLYLLLKEWDLRSLFDLKVFIDVEEEKAWSDLARRHVEVFLVRRLGLWSRRQRPGSGFAIATLKMPN